MTTVALPPNPFPGLRPFREDEETLFFGREAQVDAMIDKLAATRFLAVVGTSGSGKSSLVNCGLVPALHRGLMAGAGSVWRVATLRPGNRPLRALAEALARPDTLGPRQADESDFTPAEMMEALLRMSKLGLVDAFEQARLDANQNLLVVVDQFEELFRYQALALSAAAAAPAAATASTGDDATAFVNLLLEASTHQELPVRVVLTMRSDFLGECAQFFGLPEAINRGQYLVPRMTRDERRSAIAGPVGVGGAEIDPVLLTRLVNDVGDNPDQLSILQHALNRTWARWQQDGGSGALALRHYEAVGTMAHALNQHAEEAFSELAEGRPRALAEALFKAITDKVTDARGTRRPTRLDTLCEVTGASAAELTLVIEVFRDPSRSFLMPPAGTALRPDSPIDISHESLMRVWDRLRAWADEEAQSAQTYRRLAEIAELELAGSAGLLRQPDLQFAIDWQRRQQPNAAWAGRYRAGFETMCDFLQRSESAFDSELRAEAAQREQQAQITREQRRARRIKLWALPVILFLAGMTAVMVYLYGDARTQTDIAMASKRQMEKEKAIADEQRQVAEKALAEARRTWNAAQVQTQLYDEAGRKAPELRNAIVQAQQAAQSKSLVYLQFADPGQEAMTERLRRQLDKGGYTAPGSEQVNAVPSRLELRYFRKDDADDAAALADLLRRWNFGPLQPRFVQGYATQAKLRQFEIWLARPDAAQIGQLLQQINAATPEERKAAGQQLQDRYTASPLAIAQTLALLGPERIDALSPSGLINALYFLTRTAPLAWDSALEASGREIAGRIRSRASVGHQTSAELERLDRLLDAVKAGEAAAPVAK
ncbi:MAG: ATP-binding protein [Comamonadaceae bacterium]|nr:ATP-binding protein [Comamonadaceae bacterium]